VGTRSEALHLEFIVDIGPPPSLGETTPEEQERLRHQEGGGERALHEFDRCMEGGGDHCPERIGSRTT